MSLLSYFVLFSSAWSSILKRRDYLWQKLVIRVSIFLKWNDKYYDFKLKTYNVLLFYPFFVKLVWFGAVSCFLWYRRWSSVNATEETDPRGGLPLHPRGPVCRGPSGGQLVSIPVPSHQPLSHNDPDSWWSHPPPKKPPKNKQKGTVTSRCQVYLRAVSVKHIPTYTNVDYFHFHKPWIISR